MIDVVAEQSEDTAQGTTPGLAEVPSLGTVLVTGGSGFIGSHLVDALHEGNDVRVFDTFEDGRRERLPEDVTTICGDVRDGTLLSEAVADVDVIVHLAGQVSVAESLESPRESHAVNVRATLELLELARREDVRVVFASSAAIYGEPDRVPIREDDPKEPSSPYGIEKLAADHYVRTYGEQYDLPVNVLRFFNVYGPGATGGVVDAFVGRALAGEPMVVHGEGDQTRDFVHVDDVVQATVAAAATDATGRAYNVGTGERVSIRELAEAVNDVVPDPVPIETAPERPGDVTHSCAAIDRAREHLDYEPQVSLSSGLARLVARETTRPASEPVDQTP